VGEEEEGRGWRRGKRRTGQEEEEKWQRRGKDRPEMGKEKRRVKVQAGLERVQTGVEWVQRARPAGP
jgi:hypothetical protein